VIDATTRLSLEQNPAIALEPGEHPLDQIDLLFAAAERGDEIWDIAIGIGLEHAESDSKSAFTIGDLACAVEKRYGEKRIETFAQTIKKEIRSVKDRRTVCRAFPKNARADFLENNPNLFFSHFRVVTRVVRKINRQTAFDLLEKASALDWTVEKLAVEKDKLLGKDVKPAVQAWSANLQDAGLGRVLLHTNDADKIRQFAADHRDDPDYSVELRITYNPPPDDEEAK
jgi:hypothetical protein